MKMDCERKEKMKMRFLSLIALLGLLAGCSTTPPQVASDYNPMTGTQTDVSETMLVGPGEPREVLWLTSFREVSVGSTAKYYLLIKYIAPAEVGYLEIPPGQTLTLLADNQAIKLDGSGSLNTRKLFKQQKVDFVSEIAQYPVSRADLQKIGYARNIKVQVKGNSKLVERDFTQENYDNVRAFVTRAAL